jgi:hypothetical protein
MSLNGDTKVGLIRVLVSYVVCILTRLQLPLVQF